jgi:hypothetical protein
MYYTKKILRYLKTKQNNISPPNLKAQRAKQDNDVHPRTCLFMGTTNGHLTLMTFGNRLLTGQ